MSGFNDYVTRKKVFEFLECVAQLDKQEALDLVESIDPETVALIEHYAGIDLRETIINEGIIDTVKSGIKTARNWVGDKVKQLGSAISSDDEPEPAKPAARPPVVHPKGRTTPQVPVRPATNRPKREVERATYDDGNIRTVVATYDDGSKERIESPNLKITRTRSPEKDD